MTSSWEIELKERLRAFEDGREPGAVSLKIRANEGCFHREHSPRAYAMIDERLHEADVSEFAFLEHENGPEILAGIGVAANVIALVVAIFQARRAGVKQGDLPAEPLELVVRRFDDAGTLREETVLLTSVNDELSRAVVDRAIRSTLVPPPAGRDARLKAGRRLT